MKIGYWNLEASCFKIGRLKSLLDKHRSDRGCPAPTQRRIFKTEQTLSVFDQDFAHKKDVDRFRYQYLSKISIQKAWIPEVQRKPKHQTIVVFDWDDTLLYTTFVNYFRGQVLPEKSEEYLKRIESSACQLLETAMSLGHTYIITNAQDGWVEESAAQYMPSLVPLLNRVRIISARSTQEAKCNGDVAQWKVKAFLEMGQEFDSDILTNLISIGDSEYELKAANTLGKQFANGFTKTIKLKECPSLMEQAKELDVLLPKLSTIVEKACDLVVKLERR